MNTRNERDAFGLPRPLAGMGLDSTCALVTDGHFSGVLHGASINHVSPKIAAGGLLAYIKYGGDFNRYSYAEINVILTNDEIKRRMESKNRILHKRYPDI